MARAQWAWNQAPGLILTSYYRDPATNRQVGGARLSQHLVAVAGDFAGPPAERQHLAQHARQAGLIAVDEGTHLHLQLFPAGTLRA